MRGPFAVFADIESLIRKMDTSENDPSKSSTTQKNKYEMCGYSLFTHCSFDKKECDYRGKDCLKKFCKDLRKQARSIVDCERKKELIELTEEETFRLYIEDKCFICEKPFFEDAKNNLIKVKGHCHYTGKYRGAAHKIINLMYNIPRETPVTFHNQSSYDYHFIIKRLAEEFKGDFECLAKNKKKIHKIFSTN